MDILDRFKTRARQNPRHIVLFEGEEDRTLAAAMGVALGMRNSEAADADALRADFEVIARTISATRPTAVNLFWAVERMRRVFESALSAPARHCCSQRTWCGRG